MKRVLLALASVALGVVFVAWLCMPRVLRR
jgi:hypothetical protein